MSSAFWAEEDGSVIGYMCKVDWECEIGGAADGTLIYPSEEDLRKCRNCVDECGIVKVKVSLAEVVKETDYDKMYANAEAVEIPDLGKLF